MNLIYSTSESSFHTKPSDAEILKLKFSHCKTSPEELIKDIEQGKPFTAAVYNSNKRHTDNFISQSIFALDFDKNISIKEAVDICQDLELNFLFGYYTYRHTEIQERFRLVFICDGEVRDANLARDIYQAFTLIFHSKNDTSCLDLARIWAGTNKKVFRGISDSTFTPEKLFSIANELKYSLAGGRIRKFFNLNNIEKTGNNGNSILYRYSINEIFPICDECKTGKALIDNWKLEDLLQCRLFKTFYEGGGTPDFKYKLNDRELFCLASNLMTIVGGEKLYKACLAKNSNYAKEKNYKISWLRNQKNYNTCLIGNYSPFLEDQQSQFQTFPELLKKRGRIEIDPSYPVDLMTLAEAQEKLLKDCDRIRQENGNKVYLIMVPPGLGKTSYWRNQKGVLLGFPSNALKNEHYMASDLSDAEKLVTPESLAHFTPRVTAYLNALYQQGLGEVVSCLIKDLANGCPIFDDKTIDAKDSDYASEYLRNNKLITEATADITVFTTHIRMIHQSFSQDTYVFDENAFGSLFEQQKTTVSDISTLITLLKLRNIDTNVIENILRIKDSEIHNTPDFTNYQSIIKEILRSTQFNSNILKFFQSTSFLIEEGYIHYQVNKINKLPKDKKLIFLDATASRNLFEKAFGDRLEIIDISNVELQGTIIQDTSRSCSKIGLDSYHEKIASAVGSSAVITFNEYKKYFQNPDDTLHFGNAIGSNKFEGKNFCVVGTMTYHPVYFRFMAATLNIDCTNFQMENLKVTYKGRRFWFKTFANPELQKLHLEQVEGELIQCVHRGRLIRTDSTVRLYSNFPLLQATYV